MSKAALATLLTLSLTVNVVLVTERRTLRTVVPESPATTTPESTLYENGKAYPLLRIVDGDTLIVGVGSEAEYVRLIGIDTPESSGSAVSTCYAEESTRHLREIAKSVGMVTLHFDTTQGFRDKYGRLLAYVEVEGGADIGEQMVRDGFAQEHTYDLAYERQAGYRQAEEEAVRETRGLWSETVCTTKATE